MIYFTKSNGREYKTNTDTFITEDITWSILIIASGNVNSLDKFHYNISLKALTGCKFYTYNDYLVYI